MRAHRTTDRVFTAAPERAEQIMRVVYARIPARNWPGSTARRTASRAVSSRRLRQEFPDLARPYWRANRLWPGSYFAGPADGAPHLGPAPVHRIAAPPRLTGSRPPAFTTGLKAGALADNPVARAQIIPRVPALPGLRVRKHQRRRGQAHVLHRVAECPRCRGRLLGETTDLDDSMLVSGGTGHQVKILVVQVRNPQCALPVPVCGFAGAYLGRVAFERRDPGRDRILR